MKDTQKKTKKTKKTKEASEYQKLSHVKYEQRRRERINLALQDLLNELPYSVKCKNLNRYDILVYAKSYLSELYSLHPREREEKNENVKDNREKRPEKVQNYNENQEDYIWNEYLKTE